METENKTITRYSEAFKRKVIDEIEQGRLTQAEAKRKYGIKDQATIHYWLKRFGKNHLLNRIVRIEMPNEISSQDIIKQLKAEKQQLESALAQSQLKVIALESLVEVAEEHFQIDIKKKFGTRLPNGFETKIPLGPGKPSPAAMATADRPGTSVGLMKKNKSTSRP